MQLLKPLLILATLLSGCQDPQAPVMLEVEVKNSLGQAVGDAAVKINGIEVGRTNAKGRATIATAVVIQESNRVEISKESRSYYYGPFYDSFVVQNDAPAPVKLKATLYFVPKPDADAVAESSSLVTDDVTTETPHSNGNVVEDSASETPEAELVAEVTPTTADETASTLVPILTEAENKTNTLPKQEPIAPQMTVFTMHVYSAGRPLEKAQVYVGKSDKGSLQDGCETNARGRCVLKFNLDHVGNRTIVVSKSGYETVSRSASITNGGKIRVDLKRGAAIDIFAMESRYKYRSGIEGAQVFVKGQLVGKTDAFGHLTYIFAGKPEELVDIAIKAPGFLPTEFESDFVLSGPVSIVRYFMPARPRPVRMTLMRAQPAGRISTNEVQLFGGQLDNEIAGSVAKHVFDLPAFETVSLEQFQEVAEASSQSLSDLIRKGWQDTEIKGRIDALILPTIVMGDHKTLELSVIDSRGRVIVAAKETLDQATDRSAIDHAVASIAQRLRRQFPFEGAIIDKQGDQLVLNFGTSIGIDIEVGDRLTVIGTQIDEYGKNQDIREIGQIEISAAESERAVAKVISVIPRATIRRGDMVLMGGKNGSSEEKASSFIRVLTSDLGQTQPVAQANIYMNEQWLGATDVGGKFYLDERAAQLRGILRVVHHGYEDFRRELSLENQKSIDVKLEKQQAFLTIESVPSGATVYIDGKLLGTTPMTAPTPIAAGFVKLEVKGPAGFKPYTQVLDFKKGAIDFTGGKKITLEKDLQVMARTLFQSGRYLEAVERLKAVPKSHSDYLSAQHQIGEIYLTKLSEPALAAGAFGQVTEAPAVKNFIDKRFIGSHINEGVALYEAAERLRSKNAELATAHYLKAAEVLEKVASQLRFVPEDQYDRAVHSVGYHKALALHKLWYQTKEPGYLNQAFKYWRQYLSTVDETDDEFKALTDNARVFMKQAAADLETAANQDGVQ